MIDVIIDKIKKDFHGFHEDDVITACMKEYARIKCLEAIRNTRHKACEIVQARENNLWDCDRILYNCEREIQNIPNKDVMPEL